MNISRVKIITPVRQRKYKNRPELWHCCYAINNASQIVFVRTTDG